MSTNLHPDVAARMLENERKKRSRSSPAAREPAPKREPKPRAEPAGKATKRTRG